MLKFIFLTLLLAIQVPLFAESSFQGEALERQMWMDIKTKDWVSVQSRISPEFQSIHPDGIRNREQEIQLIKKLDIGDYTFSDFRVTDSEDTLIITYTINVSETIDKERLPAKASPRLSVWQMTDGSWQWIVHANARNGKKEKKN